MSHARPQRRQDADPPEPPAPPAPSVHLTILSAMAGADFEPALDRHVAWGLRVLDLKDGIFGRGILELSDEEAARAAALIADRGLSVHCFSTGIGFAYVEEGRDAFEAAFAGQVDRAIALAGVLRPRVVRLLAARTRRRAELTDSTGYLRQEHPWLFDFYRDAIDRLADAGLGVVLENEVGGCIWSTPGEVVASFEAIDRPGRVAFTYDVQNLWQMGTFPSVEVYERLRPLIGMVHLKGGQADEGAPSDDRRLRWRSSLEDASWPVREILGRVLSDGVSPVVCLNPSHGASRPGYDESDLVGRDIRFVRALFPEVQ